MSPNIISLLLGTQKASEVDLQAIYIESILDNSGKEHILDRNNW